MAGFVGEQGFTRSMTCKLGVLVEHRSYTYRYEIYELVAVLLNIAPPSFNQ